MGHVKVILGELFFLQNVNATWQKNKKKQKDVGEVEAKGRQNTKCIKLKENSPLKCFTTPQ